MWAYEPVTYLWPDVDPSIDPIGDGSNDKVNKYLDISDDHEQE